MRIGRRPRSILGTALVAALAALVIGATPAHAASETRGWEFRQYDYQCSEVNLYLGTADTSFVVTRNFVYRGWTFYEQVGDAWLHRESIVYPWGESGPYLTTAQWETVSDFTDHLPACPPRDSGETRLDARFSGTWRGKVHQDTGTVHDYTTTFSLRAGAVGDVVGEISYPELDCSGSLTLTAAWSDEIWVDELITQGTARCLDEGKIRLRPVAGGTFEWEYHPAYDLALVDATAVVRKG